jgi:hypothetical protein
LARQEHEEVTNDEMNYYDDVYDDDEDEDEDGFEEAKEDKTSSSRWENLNQRIKDRIVKEGQERAIANKQKREPVQDKKRRKFAVDCELFSRSFHHDCESWCCNHAFFSTLYLYLARLDAHLLYIIFRL